MKKTVKILSLVLALLMLAMAMFACNSDADVSEDEEEKKEEKYVNLSPEGVYNKISKAKDVTVTYVMKSEGFEEKSVIVKDNDNVKITESRVSGDYSREEICYVNLSTDDYYFTESEKWFFEKDSGKVYNVNSLISLSMLENEFGTFFAKDKAFEADNYTHSGDTYTFKSDLIAEMSGSSQYTINSLSMTRNGSVYTFVVNITANGETGTMELTVNFGATEVKFPEGAIERRYEEYTVNVKDTNGSPIYDAYVGVYSGEGNYENGAYTNEEGKVTFSLLYGVDYYIEINYYGNDVQYEIDEKYYFDGTSANITLAEKVKPIYKVTLKGADGKIMSDAHITIYETTAYGNSYWDWYYTDENGCVEFQCDDPHDFYVVIDEIYGYMVEEKYYFNGTEPLEIVLVEKPAYKVTIKDSDGNLVPDMNVNLYDASNNYIVGATTDSEGLAKLVTEQEYNFVFVQVYNYSGYDKYIIEDAYSFSNGSKELEIVLTLKESITVRVMNTAGDAIYNVRVFLRDKNGYSWDWENYSYTNSDGYVMFYDFDTSKEFYVTIDNVPSVYSYEESYTLEGNTLTIYLSPKA